MTIPLKSNNKQLIQDYVRIIGIVFKLTPREINVVSGIATLYYSNKHKVVKAGKDIYRFIMSQPARKAIRKQYNLSEASFNNTITALRKKNVIKGERLHPIFTQLIMKDNVVELTFKLTINA